PIRRTLKTRWPRACAISRVPEHRLIILRAKMNKQCNIGLPLRGRPKRHGRFGWGLPAFRNADNSSRVQFPPPEKRLAFFDLPARGRWGAVLVAFALAACSAEETARTYDRDPSLP